jgi:hypothetical protein
MYLAQRKVSIISDQEFVGFVEQKIRDSWIIMNNPYTNWFKRGNLTIEDLQRLIIELANYENFLYISQCLKSMYIPISNEPNFILNPLNKDLGKNLSFNDNILEKSQIFDFHNIQYKLILDTAESVGLDYQDLQPAKALKSSLEFGKKGLISLIGNKNKWLAAGASLANEISLGYWHPLYEGIKLFNEQGEKSISLRLFEANKATSNNYYSASKHEIEYLLTIEEFNRQHFIIGVEYFLKEFTEFWEGLCSEYLLRVERRVFKCN